MVHVSVLKDSKGKAPSGVLERMRSDFDSKSGGGPSRLACEVHPFDVENVFISIFPLCCVVLFLMPEKHI